MVATVPQATGKVNGNNNSSISMAYPVDITDGNIIVVEIGFYWNSDMSPVPSALTVGSIAKTDGTATIGAWAVAKSDVYDWGSSPTEHLQSIIFYAQVEGTGSCTVTVTSDSEAAGQYWLIGLNELHSSLGAFTLHDSQLGHSSTGAPTTADGSSTAGAVFIGMLSISSSGAITITPDAEFSTTFDQEDGSSDFTGSAIYRIVAGNTTDAASWTEPTTNGWVATLAVFQEPSAGESSSVSPSVSPSYSASPSGSVSASISPSVSVSPSLSPSSSASPSQSISGTTCWGHVTGVTEDNTLPFAGNWTGTGAISSSGDTEIVTLEAGEYMESNVVNTGEQTVTLTQSQYRAGDAVTLKYRHGVDYAACIAAVWNLYTVPFASLGYVQIRMESSL